MTAEPLVTIVLPTHNGSRYLREAIRSCIDQTYTNWELILVDDASTDDTPAILAECAAADKRIFFIRNEKNLRLPASLNVGFARSRGDYLTWTSDDNLYEPNAIEVMVRHLQTHPECGLVYCDMLVIGPEGEPLGLREGQAPEALVDSNCVGACFLYRRAVYEVIGDYDADMFLVEDYDYWLRVSRRFRIVHLRGQAPYRYRVHSGSLSSRKKADIHIQTAKTLCQNVFPPAEHERVFFEASWNALWCFRVHGDLSLAWRAARHCLRLRPFHPTCWKVAVSTGLRLLASRCFAPWLYRF